MLVIFETREGSSSWLLIREFTKLGYGRVKKQDTDLNPRGLDNEQRIVATELHMIAGSSQLPSNTLIRNTPDLRGSRRLPVNELQVHLSTTPQ